MKAMKQRLSMLPRAASYKMHNLYFVTFRKHCRGPVGPANYPAVHFHSQPLGFQSKLDYERIEGEALSYFFLISIQNDVQCLSPDL
jgi:hypothetical protein